MLNRYTNQSSIAMLVYSISFFLSVILFVAGYWYRNQAMGMMDSDTSKALGKKVIGKIQIPPFVLEAALILPVLVSEYVWGEDWSFVVAFTLMASILMIVAIRTNAKARDQGIPLNVRNLLLRGDLLIVTAVFAAIPMAL